MDKQVTLYPIVEYYSAVRRNDALIHTTRGTNLKIIMPSERIQTKIACVLCSSIYIYIFINV